MRKEGMGGELGYCDASGSFWPLKCIPPEQVSHCPAGCQLARKPSPSFHAFGSGMSSFLKPLGNFVQLGALRSQGLGAIGSQPGLPILGL